MNSTHNNFISTRELADALGISSMAVLKRIWSGRIKAEKIGRSYAIPKKFVQKYFSQFPQISKDSNDYYSILEVAKILGISRVAVFHKIKKGKIKAKRVGRHYVISKSEFVFKDKFKIQKTQVVETPYLSVPEVAHLMGISRFTIIQKINKKIINAQKIGRHYVITREDVPKVNGHLVKVKTPIDEFLSVAQVAVILGISRIAVFKKIKKGQMSALKIGRSYAIRKADFDLFIEGKNKIR